MLLLVYATLDHMLDIWATVDPLLGYGGKEPVDSSGDHDRQWCPHCG